MRIAAFVLASFLLLTAAAPAGAQTTQIGLYHEDPFSLLNYLVPFVPASLGVYLFVDHPVEAVAYDLDLSVVGDITVTSTSYGPSGGGSAVVTAGGTMVDLGECATPDADGKILVARLDVLLVSTNFGYGSVQLEDHADLPCTLPSYRRCGQAWQGVDFSLASLIERSDRIVQPAPGDVVEAGSVAPYLYVDESPILIVRFHEVSVDGGLTWMPVQRINCTGDGLFVCEWIVPATPTEHARVRISYGSPGPPDPDHPELEFTITGGVATERENWSAIKARY